MRLVQSLPELAEPHQLPRTLPYSVYSYKYKEPVQVLNTKLFSQEGLLYCTQARSICQSSYFLCFRVHTLCMCVCVCVCVFTSYFIEQFIDCWLGTVYFQPFYLLLLPDPTTFSQSIGLYIKQFYFKNFSFFIQTLSQKIILTK